MDPSKLYEGQTQQYYAFSPFLPYPNPIVPAPAPGPAISEAGGAGVAVAPPGVGAQGPDSNAPQGGYEGHASSYVYPAAAVAPQYPGYGVGADAQGFVAHPMVHTDVLASLQSLPFYQNRKAAHPSNIGAIWKNKKKFPKAIQFAYCEVCKINCNSQEVLNNHRQGKKHKKKLEKLTESIAPNPAKAVSTKLVENKETPVAAKCKTGGEETKKKAAAPATVADLETKRRKVLEGGAAATSVKVCTLCNVVCNSEVVFRFHVTGQKHAAMVEKQQQAALVS